MRCVSGARDPKPNATHFIFCRTFYFCEDCTPEGGRCHFDKNVISPPVFLTALSHAVSMLWWKVSSELELIFDGGNYSKPFGSVPRGLVCSVGWWDDIGEELRAWCEIKRGFLLCGFFFFFLLQGLGWAGYLSVMLSNALFCSPSTSSTSGQNMAWKNKDVLNKNQP